MKRFFRLKFGDKLAIDGAICQKETFFSAVRSFGTRRNFYVWPWTKVQAVEGGAVESLARKLRMLDRTIFSSPPPLGARRAGEIPREVYEWSKGFTSDPTNYGERTGPSA